MFKSVFQISVISKNPMTHSEQRKIILELKDRDYKMSSKDLYDFEALYKRDKDDEDLDSLSMKKLQELYEKYVLTKKSK